MIKKLSYLLLSLAILIIGYIAFNKLNYWERSVRIFKINNRDQIFDGRGRRGGRFEVGEERGGRTGFERIDGSREGSPRAAMREFPDSIRARFESERGRPPRMNRSIPDSLRQQVRQNGREQRDRTEFERGLRNGDRRGRGEFYRGKKIYLRNVIWFLAVFAAFTVVIIYVDKAYCSINKRKKGYLRSNKTKVRNR